MTPEQVESSFQALVDRGKWSNYIENFLIQSGFGSYAKVSSLTADLTKTYLEGRNEYTDTGLLAYLDATLSTRQEWAELLGVSESQVSRIRSKGRLSDSQRTTVLETYDIDVSESLEWAHGVIASMRTARLYRSMGAAAIDIDPYGVFALHLWSKHSAEWAEAAQKDSLNRLIEISNQIHNELPDYLRSSRTSNPFVIMAYLHDWLECYVTCVALLPRIFLFAEWDNS